MIKHTFAAGVGHCQKQLHFFFMSSPAVIACGVVGFLCAVFLLALLAYRMKKKDEGSYDLGDTKVSTTAYQKAPTKEFYA